MTERRYRVSRQHDVEFAAPAGGAPLRADLFVPEDAGARVPVVVWLHGGGWRFGTRRSGPDLSRFFAERGFAMVAIDYRLSDRATFPAQLEDVRSALGWIRRVAPTYGFDADAIGLWGVSAGGHLAALAALAPGDRFLPSDLQSGQPPPAPQAVVCGYPPIDFLQLDAHRTAGAEESDDPEAIRLPPGMRAADPRSFESRLIGAPIETCPDRVREANPITYIRAGAPPFLILHGLSDTAIAPHQSEILYAALSAADNDVTLVLADKLGHGFLDRTRLDEAPPRRLTVRHHTPGGTPQRVECVKEPIFEVVWRFLVRQLQRGE